MIVASHSRLQLITFALVCAAFTNIYITQPVLPILEQDFSTDLVMVSFTVSAVVLGIALANLPFGLLADTVSIRPLITTGAIVIAACGILCAATGSLNLLIIARFIQGLFIPSLTTCLVAYLAKTQPSERLNVVMGAYVSATVAGGLAGRLLGGWVFSPEHWRYAFVATSLLTLAALIYALRGLPNATVSKSESSSAAPRYWFLVKQWRLLRLYLCAMTGFAIFSSIFNFLPFHLAEPPFSLSTASTTLLYMVYIVGVLIGPVSGKLSNRIGGGYTLMIGTAVLASALLMLALPFLSAIVLGLVLLCAGFFTVHAAAVGALNSKLSGGQGRANALYTLFYYVGGWVGITVSSYVYKLNGWLSLLAILSLLLIVPFIAGIYENRQKAANAAVSASELAE